MKILKTLYYISVGVCLIQLLIYLLSPFGGPMSIINSIKDGLYEVTVKATSGYQVISLDYPPYSNNPNTKNLQLLNRFIACIYFASLVFCCLTPLFYKINIKTKYKTGIICGIISLVVFLVGGLIWRYFVKIYLGI